MRLKGSSYELLVLLLLVCTLKGAVINLRQGDACANVCSGKEKMFKYEENKIYVYNFQSKHSIRNPNSKEETLQLELQGKAHVSKITACDYGLLLSDVNLKESLKDQPAMSKEYGMMKTLLEKYPLRFGFDDGRITGVCQDNMDNEFAVNIKKGILSSLQVSMDSLETPSYLTETDIAGECITEYTPMAEPPNFVIITKKKSISGCSRKLKYFSTLTGRQYEKPLETRNMAMLDGEYSCKIKVKISEGLKESICEESHIFTPFSSETQGSKIIINQELKFDSVKDGRIDAKIPTTRSDLVMNHGDKKPLHMKQKLANPSSIISEICRAVKEKALSIKIAELFLSLIRSMSETSYEDIKTIRKYTTDDAVCNENNARISSILLEALSNVKTDASFKFLVEDEKIYKLSKLGLSVFDNPTSTMIATLTNKLNEANSYNSVTTILSSMVKSFCENTPGCMLNPDIINAMTLMTNNLGSNCDSSVQGSRSKIMYTLRAISNAGQHPNVVNLVKIIEACAMKKSNDEDIKVLSIQSVRQFPCNEDVDKFLWTIYDDVSLGSELRIEAYLSLVRCPTKNIFFLIIQKLIQEQSQQVGSFVWSHISNLMETTDRFKIDIRDMLQTYTVPMDGMEKNFNLDFKSYSKNIEKTLQRGNSAAKIDTNLIFSSSLPIPTSMSINTTIDIFGTSINLFEMGLRGKGISESIFGNKFKPEAHANPHPDVIKMDRKMNKTADKLSISLYARFMGRDVYFSPNIISDLVSLAFKPSQKSSFERSLLLIDSTASVASISGFPVELQVESVASINLNMEKKDQFAWNDMDLSTKSNYGIQISGKLMVNAHCTKIGVQSKGTIARDVEFGGKLKLKDSPKGDLNDYQFELNKMPDNSKLFSISNELSLIHKLKNVEMIKPLTIKLEKCTGEGMLKIMGMKVCFLLKEAPKFSSYLPNIQAEVTIEKFSGFKLLWKKESSLKPIRKMKSLLISAAFSGADEDTFRLNIEKDPTNKRQLYEILLWKKLSYLKFEITDKKVTGQLKSGKTEAILSGTMENKGIFTSEINVDVTSGKDTGKLYFNQKFTKSGPEIILKLTKNGENGFNLESKTSTHITNHKVYSTFARFRHSTILRYSGENEMSFVIGRSQGTNPGNEIKSKVEIFWKTKTMRNFYINQNYIFQKFIEENDSELFGKVSGTKWLINLDHEIELKDKKFNVTNNLVYFISDNFGLGIEQPSLIFINLKREDTAKKITLFETSSKLGIDISNIKNGKILFEGLVNYPVKKINRKLSSKVIWKLNQLEMYDINAEIDYATFLQLYFQHKFTSTQNGITSAELKLGDASYKISSELKLPKSHLLTIDWPGNNIEITSKVDAKSLTPFNVVVNHDLKMNNELLANIINSAKYNKDLKQLAISSIAKSGKNGEIYNIGFDGKLTFDITSKNIIYDYSSITSLKIPSKSINHRFNVDQFIDIDIDGTITLKKKTFTSKMVLENMSQDKSRSRYGYEITMTKQQDSVTHNKLKSRIFIGDAEDLVTIKWGVEGYNVLFGLNVKLTNKGSTEIMYKNIMKDNISKNSMLILLDSKMSPEYNYYYKRDMVVNWATTNSYSIKWNGEYGISKEKDKLTSYKGHLTFDHKGWQKVDLSLSIDTGMSFANVNYILSYNLENKEKGSYLATFKSIIKWQKKESRTANYFDLQANGNLDTKFKKMELTVILTKDSSTNEMFSINAIGVYDKNAELSAKFGQTFAKLLMVINSKEISDKEIKLTLTTSNKMLKEVSLVLEKKGNEGIVSMLSNMALISNDNDYKLKISRLQKTNYNNKIDLIEDIKWDSNLPYIKSGSGFFGILVQNKDIQCNFNLLYQILKVVDLKIVTSDISNNLKVSLESDFVTPIKLISSYKREDSTIKCGLDITYKDQFFRISEMEIMYKMKEATISSYANIVVKTSLKAFSELTLLKEESFEIGNIFKSYKSSLKLQLNTQSIYSHDIDLTKGTLYTKSLFGKYIQNSKVQSYEFNFKYKVQSIKDFMIDYKLSVNDKEYSKLKLVYFRMNEKGIPMRIDSLGYARFFFNLEFKRQTCNGKLLAFIEKDVKNGLVKMQFEIPQITMKFDEVTMSFQNIKDKADSYTGSVKYKGSDYTFIYKLSKGYKRDFTMTSISKGAKPQEIKLAFDFTKDYMFKMSFDKYFIVDMNLVSSAKNTKSGKFKFIYNSKEILNLDSSLKLILPKDIASASDFVKAVLGIKRGIDLNLKINGKLLKTELKSEFEISHLESQEFPGGTKSYKYMNVELNDGTTTIYNLKISFDRNMPNFSYEDQFLIKVNNEITYKGLFKMNYKSSKDFFIEIYTMSKDIELRLLAKNNDEVTKIHGQYKYLSNKRGLGFEVMKNTYATSLNYIIDNFNITLKSNIGFLLKKAFVFTEIFPVGKEYYSIVSFNNKQSEIKVTRTKEKTIEIVYDSNLDEIGLKLVINAFDEKNINEILGIEVKGSGKINFDFKSTVKVSNNQMTLTVKLNVNKDNLADFILQTWSTKGKSPYSLEMKYKGTYMISGKAMLDTENVKFSHSLTVKDGKFKTDLWSGSSNCSLISQFDCYLIHTNKARDIKIAMIWTKHINLLEFSWNKRKEQGFLFSCEKRNKLTIITISTPLRTVKLSQEPEKINGNSKCKLSVEIIRKADTSNVMSLTVETLMKGSFKSDYNLDLQIKTNLLQKGLKFSINRKISRNVADLYVLNINSFFDGEDRPFFTLEGSLRKISTRSYEIKIHATNNDNFLTMTSAIKFANEEIGFDFIVIQNDKEARELVFQFIPFRKIHLTNKRDFKMLFSRTSYQYGYRRDIVLQLGKAGPNITAYSTLLKSPFKYYAEVSGNDEKLVAHFRPVGNLFIGDVYRKLSGKKVQDLSLKMSIDKKSIMNTNLYWNPDLVETIKSAMNKIMQPDNLKSLMVNAYQNCENQISTFTSNIKLKLAKTVDISKCLEFVKGIANDIENIPNAFSNSYSDDDLYMKLLLDSINRFMKKNNIKEMFEQSQTRMKVTFVSITNTFYEWFIEAKLYGLMYNPINDQIKLITYSNVKAVIQRVVDCGGIITKNIKLQITIIGNLLDSLSKRVQSIYSVASTLNDRIVSTFKGSSLNEMIEILGEVRDKALDGLGQIVETDFIKQRIVYYKDTIENIKELISMVKQMRMKMLEYVTSSNIVKNIVDTVQLIKSMEYKEAYLNMIKPEEYQFVMDLDKGTMDMKFYVPPMIRPIIKIGKTISNLIPFDALSLLRGPMLNNKLLDIFYRYEYYVFNYGSFGSLIKMLPPFKRMAWVLGGNSVLTYDGNYIKIGPGKCSYLLARDTKIGSFSLNMNIKSGSKEKEFELTYIQSIIILPDGMIKVDGKIVDILPYSFSINSKSIKIYRDYDMTKLITSEGFTIEYFYNLDYLKVSLTGNWHGTVRGLLGSNDFDSYNDWSTPDGQITHDAGILSKSWSIGECNSKTKTGLYSVKVNNNHIQKCVDLFRRDSLSYLSRCFSLINANPYFNLCELSLQYKEMKQKEFDDLVCNLSRNYVMRCRSRGIMIRLDKSCVKCGLEKLGTEKSNLIPKKMLKFNYIFIVELTKCLLPYKSLVDNLINVMSLEKDNTYTFLAFNGLDMFKVAHFKSLNKNVNTDAEGLKSLLKVFNPSSKQITSSSQNGSTEGSQAIYDAIKMPSKAGYMEKVIFISCSACGDHTKHIFSNLAGLLKDAGISLTYLTAQRFTGMESTTDIAGIGNGMVYYFEKDMLKSRAWKKQLQPPYDVCSSLARLNDGFVWSLNGMNSEMRQRRVAETLHTELRKVKGNPRQTCTCGTGNYEDGKIECKVRHLV